jgi:hypothetical protein
VATFICRAMRAATTGALALLASAVITVAQQPPSDSVETPAEKSPAVAAPQNEATAPGEAPSAKKETEDCKGLAERPCRKNQICTWIIPKEANKSGQMPPAYCRKLGTTKRKANDAAAAPAPAEKAPPTAGAPSKD